MNLTTLIVGSVLGMAIGMAHTSIAIVMLFRPYKKWRVFGLPVPLTPGVIPSRQKELAKSIGNAVGEYIITETELRRTLLDPEVSNQVEDFLQKQMDQLRGYSGSPRQWLEEQHWDYQPHLQRAAAWSTEYILRKVRDRGTQAALLQSLRQELDKVLERKPDPEQFEAAAGRAVDSVVRWLNETINDSDNDEWIRGQIDDGLERLDRSESTVAEWLGEDAVNSLIELVHSQGPNIARLVGEALVDPIIRRKLLDALLHFLSSQWLFRALGSVVPPERMDQLLQRVLSEAAVYLQRGDNQNILVSKAEGYVRDLLSRPVGELLQSIGQERARAVAYSLTKSGMKVLGKPQIAERAGQLISQHLITQGEQSWAEIAKRLGWGGLVDYVVGYVQRDLDSWLTDSRLSLSLESVLRQEMDHLIDTPIHTWLAAIDQQRERQAIHAVAGNGLEMIARQAPHILQLVDIKQMVSRKIEEFPLPEVEKIILEIAGKELAYITYFGGILGVIIFLIQPLLSLIQ